MVKHKLFTLIPENFFKLLTSNQKEIYADCLFLLFNHLDKANSYGDKKEIIIEVLSQHVPKTKALIILRKLKEYGWIYEENIGNYEVVINFTYYAVQIVKTLSELKVKNNLDYYGYLFAIYSMLKNIEYESLGDILDQIFFNMKIIMNRLKILNANINKYIQELISNSNIENLPLIVNTLFNDYKKNIVDEYYQRLKTSDNLSKYRPFIISKLNEISINSAIINDAAKTLVAKNKFNDITSSQAHIYQQISYIISSLNNIEVVVNEIDKKNSQYIKTAITKILYIVSNTEDTTGKIKKIIDYIVKNKNDKKTIHTLFSLNTSRFLSHKSLYKVPKKVHFETQKIQNEKKLDDYCKTKYMQKILEYSRFSKQRIVNYVKELLKDTNEISASKLPLNNYEDYLRLILIFMYANNSFYKIKRSKDFIKVNGFCFYDFQIRGESIEWTGSKVLSRNNQIK